MIYSGIYKITNTVTGDLYVGSAKRFNIRFSNHVSQLVKGKHHSPRLQNAWNKYGKDAFVFEIIERVDIDALIQREQYYIDLLHPAYNMNKVAGSRLGMYHTNETKEKMSQSRKGKPGTRTGTKQSDEAKEKMRQAKLGTKRGAMSEETKKKISEAQKGKPRLYALGSKRSEETRRKISQALMGNNNGAK